MPWKSAPNRPPTNDTRKGAHRRTNIQADAHPTGYHPRKGTRMAADAVANGALGGRAAAANMTPEQRSERARTGALARVRASERIIELEAQFAELRAEVADLRQRVAA